MKKYLIAVVLIVVLAAAVIFGTKFLVKPEKIELAEMLPTDVAFYYSIQNVETIWNNIKGSRFWREFSNLRLWSDIQVASGLSELQTEFEKNLGVALNEGNLIKLFGQELVITITPGTEPTAPPKVVLLCKGKDKKSLSDITDPIIEKVKKEDAARIEESRHDQYTITTIKSPSPDQPEINLMIIDDVLAAGIGDTKTIVQSIADISKDKTKQSLADSENFKKIKSLTDSGQKQLAGLFFMDFIKMRKYLQGLTLPGPTGTPTQVATGTETINFIGGWTEIQNGLITKLYIYPNKEALTPEMKKIWETEPLVPGTLGLTPEKALLYIASTSLDLPAIWNMWQENLKKQSPEQAQTILDSLNTFKQEWGIDAAADVFPLISNEAAFIFADINTEGLMPLPKLALVLKVRDKDKVDKLIADIIAKNNEKAAQAATETAKAAEAAVAETTPKEEIQAEPAQTQEAAPTQPVIRFEINLADQDYNGQNIKALQLPLSGTGISPGYTYINDLLVIGATTKTLEELIDISKGKTVSIMQDPEYKKISVLLPEKNNQLSYINMSRLMEIGIGICSWIVGFQQLTLPQGPAPSDPAEAQAFNERKAQTEATIATINDNVVPLLKSLKAVKIIATASENKEDHIEQTLVLRTEDL